MGNENDVSLSLQKAMIKFKIPSLKRMGFLFGYNVPVIYLLSVNDFFNF